MTVSKIWVFAEATNGTVATITLEMLAKARELATTVECVYGGADADAIAGTLGAHGASAVHATGDLDPKVEAGAGQAGRKIDHGVGRRNGRGRQAEGSGHCKCSGQGQTGDEGCEHFCTPW